MSGMTKRTTIEAQIGDINLGNIQIRDGSGGAFLVDVNDPGVGLDCMAVQTTPIGGTTPTSPVMIEGLNAAVGLGGAAPQEVIVTLDVGSARGKLKSLRVYQTTAPAIPFTAFDVGVYQALPVIGVGALPDGPNTMFRATTVPITALGMIMNQVMVGEIPFRNRDAGPLTRMYVVLRGTAGGGAGAPGVYSVEVLGEELTT